jgi:hypothetical protein
MARRKVTAVAEDIIEDPDMGDFAARNRDAIYKMITGGKPTDLRQIVAALGGPKEVAPLVGRSRRTVERWVTTAGTQKITKPLPDAVQALQQAFSQARTTRAGREKIVAATGRRATLMRGHGARMKGKAKAGIITPGGERGYIKTRTFNHHVDANTMDATFRSYIEQGEDAAFTTFNNEFGDDYGQYGQAFDGWLFGDMSGLLFNPDISGE